MLRATAFFVVWLALTDGLPGDMPVGVIAAAIATWVSLKLLPPTPAWPSPLSLLSLVWVLPSLRRLMDGLERVDALLRQWPVAGLLLLLIVVTLGAALQLGR